MFELKKFVVLGLMLLPLAACNSVLFPEEDDAEVYVGEGGRVIRTVPAESNSLRADVVNRAYEGEEKKLAVVKADRVTPAKTKPVKQDPLDVNEKLLENDNAETEIMSEDVKKAPLKVAQADDKEILEESAEDSKGPSVSYRIDTFLFENGSSVLNSDDYSRIRKIVREAKANQAQVTVYGYASSRTRNTDAASHKLANFKVSSERAQNVAAALRRAGLPASKIEVIAMSDSAPVYQEVMPEGERLNRRAEVYLSY